MEQLNQGLTPDFHCRDKKWLILILSWSSCFQIFETLYGLYFFGGSLLKWAFIADYLPMKVRQFWPFVISHLLGKKRNLFVSVRSIQFDYSVLLSQAGCFMRPGKPYEVQKFFIASSSTLALKYPRVIILLCLGKWISNVLLTLHGRLKLL